MSKSLEPESGQTPESTGALKIIFNGGRPGKDGVVLSSDLLRQDSIDEADSTPRLSLTRAECYLHELVYYDKVTQKLSYVDPCFQETVLDVTTDENFQYAVDDLEDPRSR